MASKNSTKTDKHHCRVQRPRYGHVIRPKFEIPVYRVSLDCKSEIQSSRKKWITKSTPKSFSGSFETSIALMLQYYLAYLMDTGKFTADFVLDQIQLVCEFYNLKTDSIFESLEQGTVRPKENRLKEIESLLPEATEWEREDLEWEKADLQMYLNHPDIAAYDLYYFFIRNYPQYVNDDQVWQPFRARYDPQKRIPQIADVYRHHEMHCMYTGLLSGVAISIGSTRRGPSREFFEALAKYEGEGLIEILSREEVDNLQNKDLVPYNHVDDDEFEIWDKSHLSNLELMYTPLDMPSVIPQFWGGLPIEIFVPPIGESEPLQLEKYLNARMVMDAGFRRSL